MRISELIASVITDMLDEQGGTTEIQRNEFASKMGCVPSQINYVLDSRFRSEQGFIVESHRGGGGYIRITRIETTPKPLLMHVLNSIGERIDLNSVRAMLVNLSHQNAISDLEAQLILAAVSDNTLRLLSPENRDYIRASIFKSQLLTIVNQ